MNTQVQLSASRGMKRDENNKLIPDPTKVVSYCPFCEESITGTWVGKTEITPTEKCPHFKRFVAGEDGLATAVFEG